jgi:hypothetical protein
MHGLERLTELDATGEVLAEMVDELVSMLLARVLPLGESAAHLQLEVRAFELRVTLDRVGWGNGPVAHNLGELAALVEEARTLDDPLIAVSRDRFPPDVSSLVVTL